MYLSKRLAALFTFFLLMTGTAGLNAADTGAKPEVNRDIEEMLRSNDLVIRGVDILAQALLFEVYEGHDFSPFWTHAGQDQGTDGVNQ